MRRRGTGGCRSRSGSRRVRRWLGRSAVIRMSTMCDMSVMIFALMVNMRCCKSCFYRYMQKTNKRHEHRKIVRICMRLWFSVRGACISSCTNFQRGYAYNIWIHEHLTTRKKIIRGAFGRTQHHSTASVFQARTPIQYLNAQKRDPSAACDMGQHTQRAEVAMRTVDSAPNAVHNRWLFERSCRYGRHRNPLFLQIYACAYERIHSCVWLCMGAFDQLKRIRLRLNISLCGQSVSAPGCSAHRSGPC